jgi:hypothetical protein
MAQRSHASRLGDKNFAVRVRSSACTRCKFRDSLARYYTADSKRKLNGDIPHFRASVKCLCNNRITEPNGARFLLA